MQIWKSTAYRYLEPWDWLVQRGEGEQREMSRGRKADWGTATLKDQEDEGDQQRPTSQKVTRGKKRHRVKELWYLETEVKNMFLRVATDRSKSNENTDLFVGFSLGGGAITGKPWPSSFYKVQSKNLIGMSLKENGQRDLKPRANSRKTEMGVRARR